MNDTFALAEKFKSIQGEGVYTGVPMAFIRLIGCSVGKKICEACDTEFTKMDVNLGGGLHTVAQIKEWAFPYEHICITGGEPFDRDIRPLIFGLTDGPTFCHIETSGTKRPDWLDVYPEGRQTSGMHCVATTCPDERTAWRELPLWVTVSPKPGFKSEMIESADEIKWIVGGLGPGEGWPTIREALDWAIHDGKLVYVQPRNGEHEIDPYTMKEAFRLVQRHPQLRLSTQLHKYINAR